jgi:hypothetical protein
MAKTKCPFKVFTKKSVKEAIEHYEWRRSGLDHQSGTYTTAKKLRFMTGQQIIDERLNPENDPKPDGWYCVYDITLGNDMEKKREQYDDCWVSFDTVAPLLTIAHLKP